MKNNSFVFYESFYKAIKTFPKELQLEMFDVVCAYALYGIEPTNKGIIETSFILIKPNIDANLERRNNGSKGGRPPKKEEQKPTDIKQETIGYESNNHRLQHTKPNVDVDVNLNENSNVNETKELTEKEKNKKLCFDFIQHLNFSEKTKDNLKDWYNHLIEKDKKITTNQIETFVKNNIKLYGDKSDLFFKDIQFSIENGYFTLVKKHLKNAGYDENTGKYIPQFEGDYAPIKNPLEI